MDDQRDSTGTIGAVAKWLAIGDRKGGVDIPSALFALFNLIVGIVIVVALYLTLNPSIPIEYNNDPFPTDSTTYQAGDTMIITVDQCRHTDSEVTIHRIFVNDQSGFQYVEEPIVIGGAQIGCGKYRLPVTLPDELIPGNWHVDYKFAFTGNYLEARQIVTAKTQVFQIVGE